MKQFTNGALAFSAISASAVVASAQTIDVTGGATSVFLDFDTLASAASLNFSSVSDDVFAPGALGDGSVGGDRSGFFVASAADLTAILFDVAAPDA